MDLPARPAAPRAGGERRRRSYSSQKTLLTRRSITPTTQPSTLSTGVKMSKPDGFEDEHEAVASADEEDWFAMVATGSGDEPAREGVEDSSVATRAPHRVASRRTDPDQDEEEVADADATLSRRELLARIPKSSEPSYLKVPVYLADETTARFETRSATTPEQALCAAVLSQALIDLRTNVQIEVRARLGRNALSGSDHVRDVLRCTRPRPAAVREQLDRIRPQSGSTDASPAAACDTASGEELR